MLTSSANNKRDFCTVFIFFLLLDYEFSNKSFEFALLYRKKEKRKKEKKKKKSKKHFTKEDVKNSSQHLPKAVKGIQIAAQ